MKIEFRNITQVGNNHRSEVFFDDLRVATLMCTPKEYSKFKGALEIGVEYINVNNVLGYGRIDLT